MRAPVRITRGATAFELMQTMTRSGISAGSRPFARAVARRLLADFVGHGAQRQLAQRRQVALAEEVRERLFDLLGPVDLAFAQPVAQLLDRDVDVDDFVGALEERVGHRFAHAHAGDLGDRVVQRLEVLDVDGGHHVDAGVEDLEHVLVALLVAAARHVGVRQLVDDAHLRRARAMTASTSISSSVTPRYSILRRGIDFEVLQLRLGVRATVGLDEADHDVEAAGAQRVRLPQHLVGLADAGRGADVDAQAGALLVLDAGQQGVGGRSLVVGHRLTAASGGARRARGSAAAR